MTRWSSSGAAVLALALVGAGIGASHAGEGVPWTVRADVRWADGHGTEAVREAVERAAVQAANEAGCVLEVRVDPPGEADLLWTVLLVELEEETVYEDSIYGVQTPGEPGKDLLRTAHLRIHLVSQVSRSSGDAPERARQIHVEDSRRPRVSGEDPSEQLRSDVLRRVRGELAKALCRSAERLWRKRESSGDR